MLFLRAKAVCSTIQHLQKDGEHLQNVLTRCKLSFIGLEQDKRVRAELQTILKRPTMVPNNQQEMVPTPTNKEAI